MFAEIVEVAERKKKNMKRSLNVTYVCSPHVGTGDNEGSVDPHFRDRRLRICFWNRRSFCVSGIQSIRRSSKNAASQWEERHPAANDRVMGVCASLYKKRITNHIPDTSTCLCLIFA